MNFGAARLSCMAKDVLRFSTILINLSPLLRKIPAAGPIAFRWHFWHAERSQRSFSQSKLTRWPRHRSTRDDYPGFRNESKERRHVREHNLFDPELQFGDGPEHISPLNHGEHTKPVKRPPGTVPLEDTPTSDLERELLCLSSRYPTDPRVRNILLHLLYDKAQHPNATQYEALILANASPEHGSADNVQTLMEEMKRLEIPTNVNLYLAILRTLVVHPDVEVLNDVIEACENQWIEIDSEMRHLICAAYLRADMPEVGLDYLEQIEHGNTGSAFGITEPGLQREKAELWLYVLFIQYFAGQNDWDGVIRLCYRLCDDTSYGIPLASRHLDVPYFFWLSLLEQASSAKDKWVTFWVWENWALKAWIRPSPETCLRVLEICADHGAIRIAETVCIILRFLSKESSGQDSDLEAMVLPPTDQHFDSAKALLAKTYENAQPNEPRPSQTDIRRITAEWWMFDVEDKVGLGVGRAGSNRSLRINPWAVLRDVNDPGLTWARKLDQREAVMQKREEREALRQAHVRRAKIEAGYTSMKRSLPAPLIADIEKAATAELNGDETTDDVAKGPNQKLDTKEGLENRSSGTRIRLIDPKNRKLNPSVENERIRQWMKLGLDIETAVKMDDQKGNRAWRLGDEDVEDEPKPDTTTDASKTMSPRIRLIKLPETSPNEQWYSEWSQMLAARKRFEKATQRKRSAEKSQTKAPEMVEVEISVKSELRSSTTTDKSDRI